VTIEDVQSALPKNTALVEYLRYWHYITLRQREPYFAAIVLFPKRPPAFVPLGKAQEIETLVRRYQTLVRRSSEDEELSRHKISSTSRILDNEFLCQEALVRCK
jgi:hypothetical protein